MRVVPLGGGEVVGDSADRRVEILTDRDGLHATWSRFGAGRRGADLHIHHHHTDVFYVLEGELTALTADGEVVVPAGHVACLPAGVAHGFNNDSAAEVRYLNLHAPGMGFADYMRGTNRAGLDQDEPSAAFRPASDASFGPPPLITDGIAITENDGLADALYVLDDGTWIDDPEAVPEGRYLTIRL